MLLMMCELNSHLSTPKSFPAILGFPFPFIGCCDDGTCPKEEKYPFFLKIRLSQQGTSSLYIPIIMQRKSLWGSYMSLSPRTRMFLGLGGMAFATVGMLLSDKIEQQRPATEVEKKELEKLSPIMVVDRPSKA